MDWLAHLLYTDVQYFYIGFSFIGNDDIREDVKNISKQILQRFQAFLPEVLQPHVHLLLLVPPLADCPAVSFEFVYFYKQIPVPFTQTNTRPIPVNKEM